MLRGFLDDETVAFIEYALSDGNDPDSEGEP
jgi:hypothetical protein